MAGLAAMNDIIRGEQDTDIAVKLRRQALARTARCAVRSVQGQVRPYCLSHAFFLIDVTVDGFLEALQLCTFIDHAVADLFRCQSVLEMVRNALI